MAALDSLPPDQRAVVQLVLQQGRSYEELASLLGIPADAVRRRAQAGVTALADGAAAGGHEAKIADWLLGVGGTPAALETDAAARAFAARAARELAAVTGAVAPNLSVTPVAAEAESPPEATPAAAAPDADAGATPAAASPDTDAELALAAATPDTEPEERPVATAPDKEAGTTLAASSPDGEATKTPAAASLAREVPMTPVAVASDTTPTTTPGAASPDTDLEATPAALAPDAAPAYIDEAGDHPGAGAPATTVGAPGGRIAAASDAAAAQSRTATDATDAGPAAMTAVAGGSSPAQPALDTGTRTKLEPASPARERGTGAEESRLRPAGGGAGPAVAVSRRGGAILILLLSALVALGIYLLLSGGGDDDPAPQPVATATPAATPTPTPQPPQVVRDIQLRAANGSNARGAMTVFIQNGQMGFALQAERVQANTPDDAYAVWFVRDDNGDARRLGFAEPVGADRILAVAGPQPDDVDEFSQLLVAYDRVVVSLETDQDADGPGRIILRGPLPSAEG